MLSGVHRPIASRAAALAALALGAVFAAWAGPVQAAQGSGSFGVDIVLQSGAEIPATGLCRSSSASVAFGAPVTVECAIAGTPASPLCRSSSASVAFGASVTSACSTGVVLDISSAQSGMPWMPMHGGAMRYLIHIRRADELSGSANGIIGLGTVTSWRVVHLANWDYVELTVGW